jgi:hypothetical protein
MVQYNDLLSPFTLLSLVALFGQPKGGEQRRVRAASDNAGRISKSFGTTTSTIHPRKNASSALSQHVALARG